MNRINAQPERRPRVCSPPHPAPRDLSRQFHPVRRLPLPFQALPARLDRPALRGFRDRTVPPALRAPWVPRAGQVIQAPPARRGPLA